jgi:hypothetical protein
MIFINYYYNTSKGMAHSCITYKWLKNTPG